MASHGSDGAAAADEPDGDWLEPALGEDGMLDTEKEWQIYADPTGYPWHDVAVPVFARAMAFYLHAPAEEHVWHTHRHSRHLFHVPFESVQHMGHLGVFKKLRARWERELGDCLLCAQAYHAQQAAHFATTRQRPLQQAWLADDAHRLTRALTAMLKGREGGTNQLEQQQQEVVALCGLYEVLMAPRILVTRAPTLATTVAGVVAETLLATQPRITDKLPGLFLFLFHRDPVLRAWAETQVSGNGDVGAEECEGIEQIFVNVVNAYQNGFTTEPVAFGLIAESKSVFWAAMLTFLRHLSPKLLKDRILVETAHWQSFVEIVQHTLGDTQPYFWEVLSCFHLLVLRIGRSFWRSGMKVDVVGDIFGNTNLQALLASQPDSQQSNGGMDEDEPTMDLESAFQSQISQEEQVEVQINLRHSAPRKWQLFSAFGWCAPFLKSLLEMDVACPAETTKVLAALLEIATDHHLADDLVLTAGRHVRSIVGFFVKADMRYPIKPSEQQWIPYLVHHATSSPNASSSKRWRQRFEVLMAADLSARSLLVEQQPLHDNEVNLAPLLWEAVAQMPKVPLKWIATSTKLYAMFYPESAAREVSPLLPYFAALQNCLANLRSQPDNVQLFSSDSGFAASCALVLTSQNAKLAAEALSAFRFLFESAPTHLPAVLERLGAHDLSLAAAHAILEHVMPHCVQRLARSFIHSLAANVLAFLRWRGGLVGNNSQQYRMQTLELLDQILTSPKIPVETKDQFAALRAPHEPSPEPPKVPTLAELQEQKAAMRPRLQAWERQFSRQHGRKATKKDVVAHASKELRNVYLEYKKVKNQIRSWEQGVPPVPEPAPPKKQEEPPRQHHDQRHDEPESQQLFQREPSPQQASPRPSGQIVIEQDSSDEEPEPSQLHKRRRLAPPSYEEPAADTIDIDMRALNDEPSDLRAAAEAILDSVIAETSAFDGAEPDVIVLDEDEVAEDLSHLFAADSPGMDVDPDPPLQSQHAPAPARAAAPGRRASIVLEADDDDESSEDEAEAAESIFAGLQEMKRGQETPPSARKKGKTRMVELSAAHGIVRGAGSSSGHSGSAASSSRPMRASRKTGKEAVYQFQEQVLRWSCTELARGYDNPDLEKHSGDGFESHEEYERIFQALVVEEFRCQLGEARTKGKGKEALMSKEGLAHEGVRHILTLSRLPGQKIDVTEHDVLLVTPPSKKGKAATTHALGIVVKVDHSRSTIRVLIDVYSNNPRNLQFGIAMRAEPRFSVVVLENMLTSQRQYEAITNLRSTALLPVILLHAPQPPSSARAGARSEQSKILSATEHLDGRVDESQAEAIRNCMVSKQSVCLIHGPPGTGKTTTLLHLLGVHFDSLPPTNPRAKKAAVVAVPHNPTDMAAARPLTRREMLLGGRRPNSAKFVQTTATKMQAAAVAKGKKDVKRVLLCAPSNTAVDELVRRLIRGVPKRTGGTHPLKILRLGHPSKVHRDAIPYTLEHQVELRVKAQREQQQAKKGGRDECIANLVKNERALEGVDSHIASVEVAVGAARKNQALRRQLETLKLEKQKLLREQGQLQTSKKELHQELRSANQSLEACHRRFRQHLLDEANILCCTLSGSALEDVRNVSGQIPLVIVDEAAQCVEPDVLVPLQYGCTKLVLVGDPQQLQATLFSTKAKSFGLHRPMFARMQEYLEARDAGVMLTHQYRMHEDICHFPSNEFYQGRLKTAESVKLRSKPPWFQDRLLGPYKVFDVPGNDRFDGRTRSYYNEGEARAAVIVYFRLCIHSPGHGLSRKVAVITPYRRQLDEIKRQFEKHFGREILDHIEVGTVDGFQGQEKDVVIFSCVRASGSIGFLEDARRMNVALTRAKQTLIVLGKASVLEKHNHWRELVRDARSREVLGPAPRFPSELPLRPGSLQDTFWKAVHGPRRRSMELRSPSSADGCAGAAADGGSPTRGSAGHGKSHHHRDQREAARQHSSAQRTNAQSGSGTSRSKARPRPRAAPVGPPRSLPAGHRAAAGPASSAGSARRTVPIGSLSPSMVSASARATRPDNPRRKHRPLSKGSLKSFRRR